MSSSVRQRTSIFQEINKDKCSAKQYRIVSNSEQSRLVYHGIAMCTLLSHNYQWQFLQLKQIQI